MKKGEIWLVELPSNDGHEQAGIRPVMIAAESEANIAIVIPFTSNVQALRFPHTIEVKPTMKNGLSDISIVLVFQIRAIDKKRLRRKIGEIDAHLLSEVNSMLKKMLNI